MRPLTLEIEGFKSYVKKTTIDFSKVDNGTLFLVSGKTGAGKTTIFDAIVYALYGELPHGEKNRTKLMSKQLEADGTCRVALTFEVRNQRYKVVRRFKNNKSQTTQQVLELPGETTPVTSINGINDKITEIIGLDRQQFCQIVLLPQGDFQKFLLANTKDKRPILQKIFKTEIYEKITNKLKERRDDVAKAQQLQGDQISTAMGNIVKLVPQQATSQPLSELQSLDYLSDFTQAVQQVQTSESKEITVAEENLATKEEALTRFTKIAEQLKARDEHLEKRHQLDEERSTLAPEREQFVRYQESQSLYHTIQSQEENTEQRIDNNQKKEALKADAKTLQEKRQALEDEQKEWQPKIAELPEKQKEKEQLLDERKDWEQITNLTEESANNQESIESLNRTFAAQKQKVEETKQLITDKKQKQETLAADHLSAEAVQEAKESYTEQRNKFTQHKKQFDKYREVEETPHTAEEQLTVVRSQLEETQRTRAEVAISLCQDMLVSGEACPVCGSTSHPQIEKTAEVSHTAFEETQEKYEQQLEERAQLESQIQSKNEQLQNLLTDAEVTSVDAWEELLIKLEANVASLKKEWEQWQEQRNSEEKTLSALANEIEQLQSEMATAEKEIGSDEGQLSGIKNRQAQVTEELAVLNDKVSFESKAECERALKNLEDKLQTLQEEKDKLTKQANEQDKAERVNQAELKNAEETSRVLADKQAKLQEKIDEGLAAHENWTIELVKQWHESWKSSEEIQQLQERIRDFDTRDQKNQGVLDNTVKNLKFLNVSDDATYDDYHKKQKGTNDLVKKLRKTVSTRQQRYTQIEENLSFLTSQSKDYEKSREDYATTDHLYQLLSGKGSGRKLGIETDVLRRYLKRIIKRANQRLSKMTQGRYQFKLKNTENEGHKQIGLDMWMVDNYNGERDVSTLSGGETFQASIALALGLSEVVQEQAGAIDLGILFIDEGFGTLDEEEALPTAIDTLKQIQRESGRIIGLISHVPSLKDAASKELRVSQKIDGISEATFVN